MTDKRARASKSIYSKDNCAGVVKELIEFACNHSATVEPTTFLRYVENKGKFMGGLPAETLTEFTVRVERFCTDAETDVAEIRRLLYEIPADVL